MGNKQKLPKHITAHVALLNKKSTSVILKNETTGLYFSAYKDNALSIKIATSRLILGWGWPYNPEIVGKQIVF